jgi:pilus assembly protein CpaD
MQPVRLTSLCAAAVLPLLAACAEQPENSRVQALYDARAAHPIELRSRVETSPVAISEQAGITEAEQARLSAFFDDYLAAGGGRLSITASDQIDGRAAAVRRAERVASYALHRGLLPQELDVSVGPTPDGQPVVLSYQRYSLRPHNCLGDAYEASSTNYRNLPHNRLGCATQANLAAMLSNPADLAMPRTETPADAQRRSLVIQAYRAGAATDSERSPFSNDFRLSEF